MTEEQVVRKSLKSGEILERGVKGIPLSTNEVLAIYANPKNWRKGIDIKTKGCIWIWKGPVICAWEAAQWGLESRVKTSQREKSGVLSP